MAQPARHALDLLQEDHERIRNLFRAYDNLKSRYDDVRKAELARAICRELLLHATIEHDLFYPVVRASASCDALINEAEVEHAAIEELALQLDIVPPGDSLLDATLSVLAEEVEHHMRNEEQAIFTCLQASDVDLYWLGTQLRAYRHRAEDEEEEPTSTINGTHRQEVIARPPPRQAD
jgi:iron-sulfur cluster repair protein YtfE (RIC family)